ncbi:O-antigen ligase family protein [Anthocerotibacter panamensis]|uniref:O-antigen ligase family protein n=1 Tax=Anthocerotibacter panamensis TaxID=2857077 RepID=UPI001C4071F8|nr:O-antigen ligase family protein [Anthocerotibacter panamensis]
MKIAAQPNVFRFTPLILGAILALLLIFLALPSETFSVWRYLGFAIVIIGVGYVFFSKNAPFAVLASIVFAGLFEGPLKYLGDSRNESIFAYLGRDLLLYALILALLLGLIAGRGERRTSIKPPLLGIFILFGLNLFIQFFNPAANSPLASFINARLFWEMIPLYFIGYYFLRSVKVWRALLITIAIVAALNGGVAVYQSYIGPRAVASWGPGYYRQIYKIRETVTTESGEETFRPLALGSDGGFSGAVGVAAIPMILALLNRRKQQETTLAKLPNSFYGVFLYILAIGAALGIYASGSRSALIIGLLTLAVTLVLLAPNVSKVRIILNIGILSVLFVVAFQLVSVVAPSLGFRYDSIKSPENLVETFNSENRLAQVTIFPIDLAQRYPLGAGLDNLGVGAALAAQIAGTYVRPQPENSENNLNLSLLALGIPGTLLWLFMHLTFLVSGWRALKKVDNQELRTYMLSGFILMSLMTVYWPFGSFIVFPQNLLFWLLPGMMLGTAASLQDQPQSDADP